MLCNKCGHGYLEHKSVIDQEAPIERCFHRGACQRGGCACKRFVPPSDADAYESTAELVKGAIDETRELVKALPDELFVLRKKVKAADGLAEKCKPFLADLELRTAYDTYRASCT